MSEKSAIEWTEATWNPVVGCSKVSPGCTHCYAIRQAHRLGGALGQEVYRDLTARLYDTSLNWTGVVRCLPERLAMPLRWRRARRVFVNSMSDLFHERVPEAFIDQVYAVMALADRHTFQVLTKRPAVRRRWYRETASGAMREMLVYEAARRLAATSGRDLRWPGWPLPNVWEGVSVENQAAASERVPLLLQTPAAVRFLSCEPLLSEVDLTVLLGGALPHLDWVIVGGESGPAARPMQMEWLRSIVTQAAAAQVPVFVKQDAGQRPGQQGRIPDALWSLKQFPEPADG